jgi:hypothetical protein
MSKTPEQLEMDIAEYLAVGGRVVSEQTTQRVTKRPCRMPARPSVAKDTKLEVPSRTGHGFTVVLRPAQLRTTYIHGIGTSFATEAKRADDTWLVMTKTGGYLGLLQEGSGSEPWAVRRLEKVTVSIGKDGVRVMNHLLSEKTWQMALAEGARVWWAP